MREDYCCLCASDEGVFIDVYSDPRFLGKIQCCLTSKYSDKDSISSNVCYKCAFEVDQCSEFVNKYRLSRKNNKKKTTNACCLCLEPGVDGQIFDLVKERHSTNDPFQKMRDIFQLDVSKSRTQSLLVCTGCRYCLDVLYDLKLVYEAMSPKLKESIIKGNKNIKIPKTMTQVITRKTTTNAHQQKGVHLMSDTDSDSSTATVRRARKNNLAGTEKKNRQCEKCEAVVENGVDMFRYHRTGLTVCKDCWNSEEPTGKNSGRKRPKSTRKCSVFLKDLFDNEARLYKVEKDEFGNTTYIVTDEGSESDERPAKKMRSQITDKKDIKKLSLRAICSSLKRSQSQTEGSSSEESSGRRTRKTESLSDGDNKARRSKRKLSPVEEVIDLTSTSTKRTRKNPTVTAKFSQFKSPTAKKSETKVTRKTTRNVEATSEKPSASSSRPNRRQRKKFVDEIVIKEEIDDTVEEMNEGDQNYECKQCGLQFDSKSEKVNHLLTHSMNVRLQLHRVKPDRSSSSTEVEIKEEMIEDDLNSQNQDEQSDVVKISKANENAEIDIEGNDSNGSNEPADANSNSKTEEEEAIEKVEENCTVEPVQETPTEKSEEETKNKDEKEEQSIESTAENVTTEKDTIENAAVENDKAVEKNTDSEKEKKDECQNEAADNKESETEKEEKADINEDNVPKDEKSSEGNNKESTPADETVQNEESNLELEKDKEEGKKETSAEKDSDSDTVDLHLSQSENGSPDEPTNETANKVAEVDTNAPVNGCSISKNNEEVEETNEAGKGNNVSSASPLDATMDDN